LAGGAHHLDLTVPMPSVLSAFLVFTGAALAEIAGCFAFWAWLRLGKPAFWLIPGLASLVLFACVLTLTPSDHAGRAYAAYGGTYIGASLLWLWLIEGRRPDLWDLTGGAVAMLGAAMILFGPRNLEG
jgi:small multidrug resistance family-3 protein